jgi:hypothetical protein
MVISVGIRRIVVLADYPEDGTQLLNESKITLIKLNLDLLKPWISLISQDIGK